MELSFLASELDVCLEGVGRSRGFGSEILDWESKRRSLTRIWYTKLSWMLFICSLTCLFQPCACQRPEVGKCMKICEYEQQRGEKRFQDHNLSK